MEREIPNHRRREVSMTDKAHYRDVTLYVLIAAIPILITSPDPITWRTMLSVVLAGATAAKAKLSPGKNDDGVESKQ